MEQARAVIIGGGVAGCSIAYHLTKIGWRDVVVLEKGELTGGSTFHSAGLVGQLRSSVSLTRMMMYSVELYGKLLEETGQDPGWRPVGSLRLASTPERMQELKRQAGWARTFGLQMELLGPRETQERFPLLSEKELVGSAYLPRDGYVDPGGLSYALAKGARDCGAKFTTNTSVERISVLNGRVHAVVTPAGEIRTDVVVNAAGMWAGEIGAPVGVSVPVVPMAHQFLITAPLPGVRRELPTMRDPDHLVYFREEVGGLLMGGYERHPLAWGLDGIPREFMHQLLPPDWDRFEELMQGAIFRVPDLAQAEVIKLTNGPEAFTPDGEFILGESPEVRGFFTATGFCAHGIAGAGGVGKVMAEWIAEGQPSMDLWRMDIRRFSPLYRSQSYTLDRSLEVYRKYYDIHYPYEERESARGARWSPAAARLKDLGAVFGEKAGWERPNWFAENDRPELERFRPRGWPGRNWSTAIVEEHRATRERAGLFDFTSFSKIEISGPGALRLLQHLADNDLGKPVGSVTYTQLCNSHGGIECDLTVTRLGRDRFLLITGSAFATHDKGWIVLHLPEDRSVRIEDVTERYACLGLWGSRARQILSKVTTDDISHGAFPFLSTREISVRGIPVRALRVTYVGELGWELYTPIEHGEKLWDILWQEGSPLGLVAAGYRAVDSLRLEKGYRYWSMDITPERNPLEAGLGFCVNFDKGDFLGRKALLAVRERGISERLCCIVLKDPSLVVLGGEPVFVGRKLAGRVTSGGFGYSVQKSIAYAYLPVSHAKPGTAVSVELFGEAVPAEVVHEPLYDPRGERIRM